MVKLRFDGRRLGGVGGLINNGDGGAELFFSFFSTAGNVVVGFVRRLPSDDDVLIPRFFKFRGFFAGVDGLASSKKVLGEVSGEAMSVLRDRKSATNEAVAGLAIGDSGDGPGDGSVTEDESMVDMVVVGELSDDVVDVLSRLSRCMWKAAKGTPWVFPLEVGRLSVPCALVPSASGSAFGWVLCASSPNTEPNEGIGANVLGLVCMLGPRAVAGGPDLGEQLAVLQGQLGVLGWSQRIGAEMRAGRFQDDIVVEGAGALLRELSVPYITAVVAMQAWKLCVRPEEKTSRRVLRESKRRGQRGQMDQFCSSTPRMTCVVR